MLRRLARGGRGIGRAARRRGRDERPERRSRAGYGLALFGVLGMGLAAVVATWPLDVLPQASANAAAVVAPDLIYPKPSLGPPRQFPLKPTPSPAPTTPAPPPSTPPPPPPPQPSTVAPKPVPPPPVVLPPTPSPSHTPTKTPIPRPAKVLPLPAPPYHVPPHRQLSRVLVVFVVGIVPVSLARVRR
ncbi:hypothetical protein [Actinospica robiniae]|uniref:hypothetical protein n=1 Tax=Actinospica robiniae TaxID=304901 RepID=UPI000417CCEB|nr:hypothetical protein [Actinospica robiniae]